MRSFFDLIFSVLRACLRLAVLALVSLFVLAFLVLGLAAALLTVLWALLTGRRPQGWATFLRMRQASRQFQQGIWPASGRPNDPAGRASPPGWAGGGGDVVDVPSRDLGEAHPRLEQKP